MTSPSNPTSFSTRSSRIPPTNPTAGFDFIDDQATSSTQGPGVSQHPTPPASGGVPMSTSVSNASTTGSVFTNLHSLAVPMPTPNTDNAPYFRGTRVEDFLDALENHADNARLPYTALPTYVPRYCSDSIRQLIRRHAVWTGNDWMAARAFLVKLYASADKDPLITSDKLRAWVKKHAAEGVFSRSQDVDKYYRKFITQSDYLISQQEILTRDVNLLFFQGIPDSTRKKVRKGLPIANQKISSPPDVDVTLALLQREFDDTDIDAAVGEIDLHELSDSDEFSDSDADAPPKLKRTKKTVRFDAKIVPAVTPIEPIPITDVDALNRRIAELSQELASARNPSANTAERRCFICNGTHSHRLGIMYCPETRNLINEGLAVYNPHGRLVRPDGSELPRNTSNVGGMAKFLREERVARDSSSKGKTRETPPHFTQVAGVQYDGLDLINRDIYAISSTSTWPISYPVTRSQKEPLYEPYPTKKPERKPKQAPILPRPPKRVPEDRENAPTPAPSIPPPPKTVKTATPPKSQSGPENRGIGQPPPPPQPPYQNTADAWKEKKNTPKKTDQPDAEMQDATKSKGGGYHFTSTIQDMADGDAIQSRILDTIITLPLRDIIGISADLQKRFANLTKTRREYTQKTATTGHLARSIDDHECQPEGESDCDSDAENTYQENAATTSRLQFSYGAHENVEDILRRYTSAISLQAAPLFAMATGRFEGSMAGNNVTFMVDTGSELNLMSAEFYQRTSLPLDNDGARWSLKGINGPAVPLLGCVRDSPVSIGGHAFNHHFFVSSEGAGKQEIILGQPWMLWYAADISYSRSEGVQLHLWESGERRCANRNHRIPPTLSIQLCPTDSPRNADRLVLQGRAHRASIEEVSDDDAEN